MKMPFRFSPAASQHIMVHTTHLTTFVLGNTRTVRDLRATLEYPRLMLNFVAGLNRVQMKIRPRCLQITYIYSGAGITGTWYIDNVGNRRQWCSYLCLKTGSLNRRPANPGKWVHWAVRFATEDKCRLSLPGVEHAQL